MANYPGITARFALVKPDEADATMRITMKVKQWREIAEVLSPDTFEQWPLRAAIMDLIRQAEKEFYHREPDSG